MAAGALSASVLSCMPEWFRDDNKFVANKHTWCNMRLCVARKIRWSAGLLGNERHERPLARKD